ncbi:hypothetical protein M5689_008031 [Euphorbia peplus]|nr:hypothetical protein M5689_008031 [Euphorbia peplus]
MLFYHREYTNWDCREENLKRKGLGIEHLLTLLVMVPLGFMLAFIQMDFNCSKKQCGHNNKWRPKKI